jgi:hypothetical protein
MAELEGNPNAPQEADQDVRDGLVVALRQTSTSRDTELKELDTLRHQFDQKYQDLQGLIAEIEQLHQQLPTRSGSGSESKPEPVAGLEDAADPVR